MEPESNTQTLSKLRNLEMQLAKMGGINRPSSLFNSYESLKNFETEITPPPNEKLSFHSIPENSTILDQEGPSQFSKEYNMFSSIHNNFTKKNPPKTPNNIFFKHTPTKVQEHPKSNHQINGKLETVKQLIETSKKKLVNNIQESQMELENLRKSVHTESQLGDHFTPFLQGETPLGDSFRRDSSLRVSSFSQPPLHHLYNHNQDSTASIKETDIEGSANLLLKTYDKELDSVRQNEKFQNQLLRRFLDQEVRQRMLAELEHRRTQSLLKTEREKKFFETSQLRSEFDSNTINLSCAQASLRKKELEISQLKVSHKSEKEGFLKKISGLEKKQATIAEHSRQKEQELIRQFEGRTSQAAMKLQDSKRNLSLKYEQLNKSYKELQNANKTLETQLLRSRRGKAKQSLFQKKLPENEKDGEQGTLIEYTFKNANVSLRWENIHTNLHELLKSSSKGTKIYKTIQQLIHDFEDEYEERETVELEIENFERINGQRKQLAHKNIALIQELEEEKTKYSQLLYQQEEASRKLTLLEEKENEFTTLTQGLSQVKSLKEKVISFQRRALNLDQTRRRLLETNKKQTAEIKELQQKLSQEMQKKDVISVAKLEKDHEIKALRKKIANLENLKKTSSTSMVSPNEFPLELEGKYQQKISQLEEELEAANQKRGQIQAYNDVVIAGLQRQIDSERDLRTKLESYIKELEEELLKPTPSQPGPATFDFHSNLDSDDDNIENFPEMSDDDDGDEEERDTKHFSFLKK